MYQELLAPICPSCNKIPPDEAYEIDERVVLVHADRPRIKRSRKRKRPAPVTGWLPVLSPKAAAIGVAAGGVMIVVGALIDHFSQPKAPAQPAATPPVDGAMQLAQFPFDNIRTPAGGQINSQLSPIIPPQVR